jgi:nicotinate dehydrogenase subunit B
VNYDRSGVRSRDWITYPILKFGEIPQIEVKIVQRPGDPWLGVAEAAQGPTAAAIANAVFNASGKRGRHTPITAAKLQLRSA